MKMSRFVRHPSGLDDRAMAHLDERAAAHRPRQPRIARYNSLSLAILLRRSHFLSHDTALTPHPSFRFAFGNA